MLKSRRLILLMLLPHAFLTTLANNYSSLTINSSRSRTKNAQSCALFTQNRRDLQAKLFQEHLDRQARISSHHGHHNHNRRLLKPSSRDNNGPPIIVIHHFNKKDYESDQGDCSKRHIALESYAKRLNFTLQNRSELDDGSSRLIGTSHKNGGRTIATVSKSTHNTGIGINTLAKITGKPLKITPAPTRNEARKVKFEESDKLKRNQNEQLASHTTVTLPTVIKFTTGRDISKALVPKSNTPHTILTKVFVIPIQEEGPKSDASEALKTVKIALNKAAKRSEPQYKKYSNDEGKHEKKVKKFGHHSSGKKTVKNNKKLYKHTTAMKNKENKMKRTKPKHYIFIRHYTRRIKRKHLKGSNKKFKERKRPYKHKKNKKAHKHHIDKSHRSKENEFKS